MKGSGERSRTVAERLREEAGFDHRRTVVSEAALEVDLEVQRFLRAGGGAANETGAELDKLTFEGKFVVRISPDTLRSDDAIVATIAHEVHEITGLRAAFEANADHVYSLINPRTGTLHCEAWDVADELVRRRQAQPRRRRS